MEKALSWHERSSISSWKATQTLSKYYHPWLQLDKQVYRLTSQITEKPYDFSKKLTKKTRKVLTQR